MKSIHSKLIASYLFIILAMTAPLVYLFVAQNVISTRYIDALNHMLVVESIPDDIDGMISTYRRLYLDTTNESLQQEYTDSALRLVQSRSVLDESIVDTDSRLIYEGLDNVVGIISDELDKGITLAGTGDLAEASAIYDSAVKKSQHIEEITAELVLQELEVMQDFQDKMVAYKRNAVLYAAILFSLIVLGCIFLAALFARELFLPVTELSRLSSEIAAGNLNVDISKDALSRNDETGSLALTFQSLLSQLRHQIATLNQSKEQIKKSKAILEEKNEQLEKFNKFMIDRELKMVELKKKIADLEPASDK